MKQLWQFKDLGTHEDKITTAFISKANKKGYTLLDTVRFKRVTGITIDATVKKKQAALMEALKKYKGPKDGKPRPLAKKEVVEFKQKMLAEMSHKFLLKVCIYVRVYVNL